MFPVKFFEVFKNNRFMKERSIPDKFRTAPEFIGDTTLFHETILKKHTNGKTNFQDGKEYNRKQHFE